ncbi:MAG: glycosyltransferase [Thermoanaerobaculia bacterium]
MLLSVCLITKDEERFLAGCLESVLPVADEIVVVDTGSADRTLEIAASYGCRVVQRPWDDDFSAARNAGIDVARGRWILCMDADERLCHPEALPPALLAAPPEVGGFFIERHDLVTRFEEGNRDIYPIGILRLFRNHEAIRYEGIVHERPNETVLRAGFEVRGLATLKLIHLVSQLPQERLIAKQKGYLRLLDRELERDVDNFWARYYRGKTLWFLGRKEEAEAELRGIVESSGAPVPLRASAGCMLAALLSEADRHGEAVGYIEESLALLPGQSLAYYVLAEALYASGYFEHALAAYLRVRLSMDPDAEMSPLPGDLCMTREKRAYKLGCCHLALGRLAAAEEWFQNGLEADPAHGGCHYGLARTALLRGDRAGARERLETALTHDPLWRMPRELLAELIRDELLESAPRG